VEDTALLPNKPDWTTPQFSVERSFGIAIFFITHLWPLLEKEFSNMSEDDIFVYGLFSDVACGFETSAEWNKAIYRITKIRKKDQKNIKLSEKDVFFSLVELAEIHDARYVKGSISYLIDLLRNMLIEPKKYLSEWSVWTKTVNEINNPTYTFFGFNWLDDLREPETEDYP
jgi:hypothetical protein